MAGEQYIGEAGEGFWRWLRTGRRFHFLRYVEGGENYWGYVPET